MPAITDPIPSPLRTRKHSRRSRVSVIVGILLAMLILPSAAGAADDTSLVSVNAAGTDGGNGDSSQLSISADGMKVAFESTANDLVGTDTNRRPDVFVRDLTTGTTTLVSVNAAGTDSGNGVSYGPSISADGTKVAFGSDDSNLVGTDTNGTDDIFVRDLTAGTTTLVSVNAAGTDSGNGDSFSLSISADGTKVAFGSSASDLVGTDTNGGQDVFVRDLTTRTTTLVSVNLAGNDSGSPGSHNFYQQSISADGTKVVFTSQASDLVGTDTNGAYDVFVRDLSTGVTELVSVNAAGTDSGNSESLMRAISADATKIAFTSEASDLVGTDTNGLQDVFARDLTTGTTILASINAAGTDSGNAASIDPVMSADGTKVAFSSSASDLVGNETKGRYNAFERDLTAPIDTRTTLSSSHSPSIVGERVTYHATVSPAPVGGAVKFSDAGIMIAGCGHRSVNASTGRATCHVTYGAPGSHLITAAYSGDAVFGASTSSALAQEVAYAVKLLYDPARSRKSGSTIPIKVQLLDYAGNDVSSPGIVLTVSDLSPGPAPGSPPSGPFTYMSFTQGPGYQLNVKTTKYPGSTYTLSFTAGGDPTTHTAGFKVGAIDE